MRASVTPDAGADRVLGAAFPLLADPDRVDPASVEALAAYRVAEKERSRLDREFERHLSPAALELWRQVSDAHVDAHGAANDLHVAELARHLPGLAPTIRLLWAHVIDCRFENVGQCCTTGPVEP